MVRSLAPILRVLAFLLASLLVPLLSLSLAPLLAYSCPFPCFVSSHFLSLACCLFALFLLYLKGEKAMMMIAKHTFDIMVNRALIVRRGRARTLCGLSQKEDPNKVLSLSHSECLLPICSDFFALVLVLGLGFGFGSSASAVIFAVPFL